MNLKRERPADLGFCLPIKRPDTKIAENAKDRIFLGSVRVDFQKTHAAFCSVESRVFCYAKCEILKKKISKMLRGTAAITIAAERVADDAKHPILIRCNGTAIGSFSGATAEVIASGLDSGQLALQGGMDKAASWSEADFDVYFVERGDDAEATASDWTRRLLESCDDFEAKVRAEERICSSGSCDCC